MVSGLTIYLHMVLGHQDGKAAQVVTVAEAGGEIHRTAVGGPVPSPIVTSVPEGTCRLFTWLP